MNERIDVNAGASPDAFRWAIIGYGHVAVPHTAAIMNEKMKLVGFSTSKPEVRTGDATGLEFNIGPTKGIRMDTSKMLTARDAKELFGLLGENGTDGVIVCSPTNSHLAIAKCVAEAGFHCFVEKPAADNVRNAESMIEAFKGRPNKLVVGHVLPAFPEFAALRSILLQRGLNQVKSLTMERCVPWEGTDDEAGTIARGGFANDLLIHDAQLLCSVGRPVAIRTVGTTMRYDLPQWYELNVTMHGCEGAFRLHGGATRSRKAFHHGYSVEFKDGSTVIFDGSTVTGLPEPIEPKSVAEIFGTELAIAARYFRGQSDASFLDPNAAVNALILLEEAEASRIHNAEVAI